MEFISGQILSGMVAVESPEMPPAKRRSTFDTTGTLSKIEDNLVRQRRSPGSALAVRPTDPLSLPLARKRSNPDPAQFSSEILTDAEKSAIIAEVTEDAAGTDAPFPVMEWAAYP